MTTSNIPGVDRDGLAAAIHYNTRPITLLSANRAADVALAYIAAHHECACDREHADDEWVEVDEGDWRDLPRGARLRNELMKGCGGSLRRFVHRDDLPDPDAAEVERMAKAIFASVYYHIEWGDSGEDLQEHYRKAARAALAAYREGE